MKLKKMSINITHKKTCIITVILAKGRLSFCHKQPVCSNTRENVWILSMVSGPECLTVVTLIIIWFFLLPFVPNDLNIIYSTKSLLGEKNQD